MIHSNRLLKLITSTGAVAVVAFLLVAATTTRSTPPADKFVAMSSDSDVVHFLMTASKIGVAQAELAMKNSEDEQIEAYATKLKETSDAVRDSVYRYTSAEKVTPTDNEWSKTLSAQADTTIMTLKQLEGDQFDAEFADNQTAYQMNLIETINKKLLPATESDQLRGIVAQLHESALDLADRAKKLNADVEM